MHDSRDRIERLPTSVQRLRFAPEIRALDFITLRLTEIFRAEFSGI